MNVAGENLFARATLAKQKDCSACARDVLDGRKHFLHDLRTADGQDTFVAGRDRE